MQLCYYYVMECIIFTVSLECWVKKRGTLVGEQKHLLFDVCAPLFFEMPHVWQ